MHARLGRQLHGYPSPNTASHLHAAPAPAGSALPAPVCLERRTAMGAALEGPGTRRHTACCSRRNTTQAPHFLGAVVLQQLPTPTSDLAAANRHRRTAATDDAAAPAGRTALRDCDGRRDDARRAPGAADRQRRGVPPPQGGPLQGLADQSRPPGVQRSDGSADPGRLPEAQAPCVADGQGASLLRAAVPRLAQCRGPGQGRCPGRSHRTQCPRAAADRRHRSHSQRERSGDLRNAQRTWCRSDRRRPDQELRLPAPARTGRRCRGGLQQVLGAVRDRVLGRRDQRRAPQASHDRRSS